MGTTRSVIQVSGLLVQPLTLRIEEWLAQGKLAEAELDDALDRDARALLDHGSTLAHWAGLEATESLVDLAAARLGGETGLVEWAGSVVEDWLERDAIRDWVERAQALVDGPGFLASHASERLLQGVGWRYEGGRDGFRLTIEGLGEVGTGLRVLVGALLAGLVERGLAGDLDVRFAGVDEADLVVFGERVGRSAPEEAGARNRLHRAALVAPA